MQIQGLEVDNLVVDHVQVNQAPKMRRRTYRAHGRINGKHESFFSCTFAHCDVLLLAYMASPCHIEIILAQKGEVVKKAAGESRLCLNDFFASFHGSNSDYKKHRVYLCHAYLICSILRVFCQPPRWREARW